MKHTKRSVMTLLLAAALLLSGCAENEPAPAPGTDLTTSTDSSNDNSSADTNTSENASSETESADPSQSTDYSDSSSYSSDDIMFWNTQKYLDLKGEELVEKFGWPYDAAIDIEGMTAQRITVTNSGDIYEDIPLSEISNRFRWAVKCDYGCLAVTPEDGGEYEYKKYKAGDRIGDFTVKEIETEFHNLEAFDDYFRGVRATFEGETTLTGELIIYRGEYYTLTEISFYPDEESRKKLPIVNFAPKIQRSDYDGPLYPPEVDNLIICLGEKTDYPEIDFTNIPADGTRVKVKIKIKDYGYRAQSGLQFLGGATIVDGGFEIL